MLEPVSRTSVPMGPLLGVNVRARLTTVNTVLEVNPMVSVPVIWLTPGRAEGGVTTDCETCPLDPATTIVHAGVAPANVKVTFPGVQPVPETVTVEPASPLVGDTEMEGVTVKVSQLVLFEDWPFKSLPQIVCKPLAAGGIVPVTVKLPVRSVIGTEVNVMLSM